MRNDPGENGGLFVGRRPGTAPVRYRTLPQRGAPRRQRIDGFLAGVVLSSIVLLGILCWGPIPLLCLWICAQVNYLTGSVSLGIASAFVMLITLLFGALQTMHDIDRIWIVLRRAAGHDQRSGALERVFAITAALGVTLFVFWFLAIHGVGSDEYSGTQVLHAGFPQLTNFTVPRMH
jgi:ABC-type multidrug transport system fused ATPase/permease subunit